MRAIEAEDAGRRRMVTQMVQVARRNLKHQRDGAVGDGGGTGAKSGLGI